MGAVSRKAEIDMGCLIIIVGILYILSPIDLWPGIIDDMICLVLMILLCARNGINPFEHNESDE